MADAIAIIKPILITSAKFVVGFITLQQIKLIKMNLTYAYILLILAIGFEVLSTSFLKDTNGFTNFYPSLLVIVALCICLYLMSHSMKFIPVGIVYATWAGLGIVAIAIIGVIKYKQIPNMPTIIGLGLIVIGVTIVNLMNDIDVK